MSITFEETKMPHTIYSQWTMLVEYRWDKYNGYETFVCCDYGEKVYKTLYHNTYATKEGAKRAYQRQVRLLKKGESVYA